MWCGDLIDGVLVYGVRDGAVDELTERVPHYSQKDFSQHSNFTCFPICSQITGSVILPPLYKQTHFEAHHSLSLVKKRNYLGRSMVPMSHPVIDYLTTYYISPKGEIYEKNLM